MTLPAGFVDGEPPVATSSASAACWRDGSHTDTVWLPWAIAAGALIVLGCWDPLFRGTQADCILIGLAGYEMVIGLTEENPRGSA